MSAIDANSNSTESTGYMLRDIREAFNLEPLRERVRQLEKDRLISQFCRQINLSRTQLYYILSGKSNPTEATLTKILEGLDMCLADVQEIK